MADGYGEVAPYGELKYKQDRPEGNNEHFRIMMEMFPVKQLVEPADETVITI